MKKLMKTITALTLCLVLLLSFMPVSAGAQNPRTFSYSHALNIAFDNLSGLIVIEDTIEFLTAQRAVTQRQINALGGRIQDIGDHRGTLTHIHTRIAEISIEIAGLQALNDPQFDGMIAFLEGRLSAYHSMMISTSALYNVAQDTRAGLSTQREILRQTLNIIDRQRESLEISMRTLRIATELNLRVALSELSEAERGLELAMSATELGRESFRQLEILHRHGRVSDNQLRAARISLSQAELYLESARGAADSASMALNRLLGLPATQSVRVNFGAYQITLPNDLDTHIENTAANNLMIRQLENDVEIRRLDLQIANLEVSHSSNLLSRHTGSVADRADRQVMYDQAVVLRDDARRAHETAIRELEQARENLVVDIHNHANNLNLLSLQEYSLRLELEDAERQLELAELSFSLGRISRLDVETAAHMVLVLENQLASNLNAQWVAGFGFVNQVF